jgi:hypothetical protein
MVNQEVKSMMGGTSENGDLHSELYQIIQLFKKPVPLFFAADQKMHHGSPNQIQRYKKRNNCTD